MLQDYLTEAARCFPSHPALVCEGAESTFEELDKRVAAISSELENNGLRAGDHVLILLENGVEYVVAYFGVLRAGGVVVPLNPNNIGEFVRDVARNCNATHVICRKKTFSNLGNWWEGCTWFVRSECEAFDLGRLDHCNLENLEGKERLGVEDPAVVLYTSGTTGQPKGVVLTHRNLEANTRSILSYLDLRPTDRTLAVLPFCYSYGNSLLLTHVAACATLIIENKFALIGRVLQTMRNERVTGFSGVPSHFSILLDQSNFLGQQWPDLRYVTCAGGGLPLPYIERLRSALPGLAIHVMYGQTEGSARLSSLDPALIDVKRGSIGKGIPGVLLKVVDVDGNDVKPGEVGEIVVSGDNIMRGYLGDPEATAKVLIDGWLHTGDFATVDEDGFIYIRGRAKEFIKSGGYRVGPQQIEEAILRHPDVVECAVVGVPDPVLDEAIVAYVVFRGLLPPGRRERDLMHFIRGKLPIYMVPKRIEPIDCIPKTASGKPKRLFLKSVAVLDQRRSCAN